MSLGAHADELHWLACDGIVDREARLACYDEIARSVRAARAQPRTATPAESGQRVEAPEPKESAITARVVEISRSSLGRTIVTLDNGQVWMANEPDRHRPTVGETVTVTRNALRHSMRLASELLLPVHRVDETTQ